MTTGTHRSGGLQLDPRTAAFVRNVDRVISEHVLLEPHQTVLVAVSGGVDSMVLLDYLVSRRDLALNLVIAHLNHALRGEESEGDELLVRETARHHGLPVECGRADIRAVARENRISLEEAGREARYRFFFEVARKVAAHRVALAHHADDQAETVLMRLLRGSGPGGLRGMETCSPDRVCIRPFLQVTRSEIENYADKRNVTYRHDSSNDDPVFLRNRIRNHLLPILKEYNPAIVNRLVDTASIMAADEGMIADFVARRWAAVGVLSEGRAILDLKPLLEELPGMRFRLYRHAIASSTGNLRRIAYRHLEAIDRLVIAGPPNGTLNLPCGLCALRAYEKLVFLRPEAIGGPESFDLTVSKPGIYVIPSGIRIILERREGQKPCPESSGRMEIAVDLARYPLPWTVRSFRPGDRLIPLGMKGHKKVKEIFIDEKIPRSVRNRIPLFFCGDQLFWVAGLRKSAVMGSDPQDVMFARVERLEFVDEAVNIA